MRVTNIILYFLLTITLLNYSFEIMTVAEMITNEISS